MAFIKIKNALLSGFLNCFIEKIPFTIKRAPYPMRVLLTYFAPFDNLLSGELLALFFL